MKNLKRIVIAAIMIVAFTVPASAQFAWGLKVGVNVNSLKFDGSGLDSDNRAGFTGGLMAEFMFPIVNLGVDASVMYVNRTTEINSNGVGDDYNKDYIEIPVNLKWKIGIPVVGNIVSPYIFTGPSFSFLTSKKAIENAYRQKAVDVAWNVGIGVQLLKKLQVGASYGFGLNNTLERVGQDGNWVDVKGKNRYWTVTAAWLF